MTVLTTPADHTLYAKWMTDAYSVENGAEAIPIGTSDAVRSTDDNSSDGKRAIMLGGVGLLGDGQMAGFEWTVRGTGVLAFDWKVSSEADWDWLPFYEVGVPITNRISGTLAGWTRVFVTVTGTPDMTHILRWEYVKDPIGDYVGLDCGWIDAISWSPLYTLTVNGGKGNGVYTNGTIVALSADAPPANFKFFRWTGDTNSLGDLTTASTTLVMPATNAVVTSNYEPADCTLSVINGSGIGVYPGDTRVEIRAACYENKRFYRWAGDVANVADVVSPTTTVTTAGQNLAIQATYFLTLEEADVIIEVKLLPVDQRPRHLLAVSPFDLARERLFLSRFSRVS